MHVVIRLLPGLLLLCCAVSARADLTTNPGQLSFPLQVVGDTAGPMDVTLLNTGNATITVVSLTSASGVYARAGGSCGNVPFTIAAQASCTLSYTFTPVSIGTVYQTLRATPSVGAFVDFGLAGEADIGRLTVQPNSIRFMPAIPVGAISQEYFATLENSGRVPMQVTAIAPAVVPSVDSFVRTGGTCPEPPFTINAFFNCTVAYTFAPVAVGEATLDLRFHNSTGSPESVTLSGEGLPGDPVFANGFEGN